VSCLGVRDEELCITPDTIDELLIALQTSADASLDSQNTPCNMYTHVINSGSPAADPSAAERSAEYETLRCRPAGTGFAGPDYSMYAHDMSLLGSTLAATMAGVTPRTTTVRFGQDRDRLSPSVCSLPGTRHEC